MKIIVHTNKKYIALHHGLQIKGADDWEIDGLVMSATDYLSNDDLHKMIKSAKKGEGMTIGDVTLEAYLDSANGIKGNVSKYLRIYRTIKSEFVGEFHGINSIKDAQTHLQKIEGNEKGVKSQQLPKDSRWCLTDFRVETKGRLASWNDDFLQKSIPCYAQLQSENFNAVLID